MNLSAIFLFLNTSTDKSVNKATPPRINAILNQSCPCDSLSLTKTNIVLTHSKVPNTKNTCIIKGTQRAFTKSIKGNMAQKITRGKSSALEKCAPSTKQLKMTGNNLTKFISPLIKNYKASLLAKQLLS